MVLIFTAEPETLTVHGQDEPADRPVVAPAARAGMQGVVLRQYLDAYRDREE